MSSTSEPVTRSGPVMCANHAKVETAISCSNCGKPICPDCMVQAAVGIKCRECARLPRSARVSLRPAKATQAAVAAFGVGTGFGVLLAFAGGFGLGFFTFVVAYLVGLVTGRATLRAGAYYRATSTGWIAAAGAAWSYVCAGVVVGLTHSGAGPIGVQGIGALIAGYIAYREAS